MTRTWTVLAFTLVLGTSCTCNRQAPSPPSRSVAPRAVELIPLGEDDARHLLLRGTFGPSLSDVERVSKLPLASWLDEQLASAPDSPELVRSLAPYAAVFGNADELASHFPKGEAPDEAPEDPEAAEPPDMRQRVSAADLLRALQMAELTRQILDPKQLRAVMTDFWVNHFNVQGLKGQVAMVAPSYVAGIRTRALGNFGDLLSFTAHHPAMLVYLDAVRSVAPRGKAGGRGLNENYARELLELHTLGVAGGYDENDVREVARILTGWSTRRDEGTTLAFEFREGQHDDGSKQALGHRFEPAGEEEGKRLLEVLATHASTARHLATKLCRRFVSDEPDDACVATTSRAFLESSGDVGVTLRALLSSESFWFATVRGKKLKSPLEFVVSSARALGLRPDGSDRLGRKVAQLGEGLLRFPAPTGYPEESRAWLSTGNLWSRLDLAVDFTQVRPLGLEGDPSGLFSPSDDVARRAESLLLGRAGEPTRSAVADAVADVDVLRRKQRLALTLYLGSPEFQHQ